MRPFQTRAPKPGECEVSLVVQRPVCTNKAVATRDTGKRHIHLCKKHEAKFGQTIGRSV